MSLKNTAAAGIPPDLMDKIIEALQSMTHGNVTLVTQNFRLVQIERNEKIRACDMGEYEVNPTAPGEHECQGICRKIQQQFRNLEYGQIVIVVKTGRIVQVERTEKHRFQEFTGRDGEGI